MAGPLQQADSQRIGLWGHSMGGGISQRVITVSDDVDAAVLYGAMSGDEALNHQRILYFTNGANGLWDDAPPDDALQRISPINYLDRVTAAVSIHHGDQDATVPPAWSDDLCQRLQDLNKPVECYSYPGQPHTFTGDGDRLFIQRVQEFWYLQCDLDPLSGVPGLLLSLRRISRRLAGHLPDDQQQQRCCDDGRRQAPDTDRVDHKQFQQRQVD